MQPKLTEKEAIYLVTGASGLLGKVLIEQLLEQGYKVRAVVHKTPLAALHHANLEIVYCDLLDVITLEEIMQGISYVFHCAGLVKFTPNTKKLLYKINVEATANVVNAALNEGVKKLVHVSSVAALGRMIENEAINETMSWTKETGGSVYGHSKYLGELEVWRGNAEGLPSVVVNPSIILGPGNWLDGSTAVFKKVFDGLKWYAEGSTGFVDVRDVSKAMILLMQSNTVGEKYIISGHNKSFKDIVHLIADSFSKKRAYKKVTPFLANIIWRIEKIRCLLLKQEPLVTKETAKAAMAKVRFDNSKLIKAFPSFEYHTIEGTISFCTKTLQQKINN